MQVQEQQLEGGTFLSQANRSRPQARSGNGYLLNGLIFDRSQNDIKDGALGNHQLVEHRDSKPSDLV